MFSQTARPALVALHTNGPQSQPRTEESRQYDQLREQPRHKQHQVSHVSVIPILPPVAVMKRADAYTPLRYNLDILTINNEKYVRLGEYNPCTL